VEFREKTQNKGYYGIQGHSRSREFYRRYYKTFWSLIFLDTCIYCVP